MATAEHAMWVTKRYPALGNRTGFVMVPDASRAAMIADGGAQDTFSGLSFINSAPAIASVTFTPAAVTTASPVGTTAGTFAATGGTAPFEFRLYVNPGAAFAIEGNTLKTAITPLTEGAIQIGANCTDAAGRRKPVQGTVTVTAPAAPQAARKTVAKK